MTSVSIVREKETGTMEVLLVSAGATDMDHFCQDDSLFFAFVRESCRYSGIGAIRPRSTDVGFDGWFSRAFFALFGAFAGIRVVYFYNG